MRRLLSYHELFLTVVQRDLRVRYKQALLGIGWAMLLPLVQMGIFTIVFTRVVPVETDLPYPVYAYAGLVPWTFFTAGMMAAATSLTGNFALVTKVACPREIFPLSAIAVALVDFLAALLVLFLLMLVYGIPVTWTVLALPVVLLVQITLMAGLGLLLSMGNLFFRDVRYLTSMALTVLMFVTSVVYPVERVEGTIGLVLQANPLTPLLNAYRSVLLHGELPATPGFLWTVTIAVLLLGAGWSAFQRAQPRFAEMI